MGERLRGVAMGEGRCEGGVKHLISEPGAEGTSSGDEGTVLIEVHVLCDVVRSGARKHD